MMNHQNTKFEIFISTEKERKVFSHVCLAYWKPEITYNKAIELNYKTLIKKNPVFDTFFIWDRSGNMFEIKGINE